MRSNRVFRSYDDYDDYSDVEIDESRRAKDMTVGCSTTSECAADAFG